MLLRSHFILKSAGHAPISSHASATDATDGSAAIDNEAASDI